MSRIDDLLKWNDKNELAEKLVEAENELAHLQSLVDRLKEDGERLARKSDITESDKPNTCIHCGNPTYKFHKSDCPTTLHQQLMAEIGKFE